MSKYLGVTYLTESEFNSPTAAMLASAEVFAVGGDSSTLYVSNGRSLVASSGDPAPTIDGVMANGQTLRARLAPGWTASGYVWRRDGTPISGATSVTYVAQEADVAPGVVLTVEVTGLSRTSRSRVAAAATRPDTPLAPVLTAIANAISVAYTAPASSTAILESQFLASTGTATALTGSPQTIVATADTAISGQVRFRNAQGWSDYSPQSNTVTPMAVPSVLYSSSSVDPGTSTASGFMTQATTKDTNRLQTIIRNQTPFTLVTAEQTSNNLTVTQPSVGSYIDLPPNSQNRIEGNASKMWVGVKAIAPSSVSSSGTLCTIVFTAPHAMLTGDILTLIDFVPTGYNGQLYSVTVVNATTLTVNLAASASAVTTMGKAFPRPITGVTVQTTTTP